MHLDKSEIEFKLKELILSSASAPHLESEMTEELDLTKDFAFNSISIMKLVVDIETLFDIQFDDDFLLPENISRYKSLRGYLYNTLNKAGEGAE